MIYSGATSILRTIHYPNDMTYSVKKKINDFSKENMFSQKMRRRRLMLRKQDTLNKDVCKKVFLPLLLSKQGCQGTCENSETNQTSETNGLLWNKEPKRN